MTQYRGTKADLNQRHVLLIGEEDRIRLTNTGLCRNTQTLGHIRADARLRCVHDDDVSYGKQEGCGLDEFSSFLLQRRRDVETILIVLLVLFLLGGGGWGYSRWRA